MPYVTFWLTHTQKKKYGFCLTSLQVDMIYFFVLLLKDNWDNVHETAYGHNNFVGPRPGKNQEPCTSLLIC